MQTEHFETSSLTGENVGKAKQLWLHKINSPFSLWKRVGYKFDQRGKYNSLLFYFLEAVFLRIGEDYVRNMHSYPENQPKQEGITILCSVYIAYSYWIWI